MEKDQENAGHQDNPDNPADQENAVDPDIPADEENVIDQDNADNPADQENVVDQENSDNPDDQENVIDQDNADKPDDQENIVDQSQIDKLKEIFQIFDRDNSGFIDPDELGAGLRAIGCNPTDAEILQMVEDASNSLTEDSKLNFESFCQVMSKYRKSAEEVETELLRAFMVFDKNGDNSIDATELREALKSLGHDKLTDEEVDDMLAEADTDANGRINYRELVAVMCRY